MKLTDNVETIKGVGTKTASFYNKLNIKTVDDLLHHFPRYYLRYEQPVRLDQVVLGERITIRASLISQVIVKKVGYLQLVTCRVSDGFSKIQLLWFHSPYIKKTLKIGYTYNFVGVINVHQGQRVMEHPEYYTDEQYSSKLDILQPVYSLTEGLSNTIVQKNVRAIQSSIEEIQDYLPDDVLTKYDLISEKSALLQIHFPNNQDMINQAKNRLAFDEFFLFLLLMEEMKQNNTTIESRYRIPVCKEYEEFIDGLPYKLTNAQLKTLSDICKDLSGNTVMNRLVQGDVGSGKTIIALLALLLTVKAGYQGALMAPTEVLATQHYENFVKQLKDFGIRVALLVGSMTSRQKQEVYELLEDQKIDIIIGTNAIIQEKVHYKNLGLVVTDEQHRFGVRQRKTFSEKGLEPHILVMSATPIPRTLAIIMYGDLDISIMNEMPKNRLPIKNCVVNNDYRPKAYEFMMKEIQVGHQVYVICPMVEASETVEAENVMEYCNTLQCQLPNSVRITYLHGKMTPKEKQEKMNLFYRREIDILVSTTVIEVGIDNPNATVIMIENAERFGLAQLHQLRGRVGRGEAQSYCIMMCGKESKKALERLEVLNHSNDGFYIANEDLRLRGPGDFFGVLQSGDIPFIHADIYNNAEALTKAKMVIEELKMHENPISMIDQTKLKAYMKNGTAL